MQLKHSLKDHRTQVVKRRANMIFPNDPLICAISRKEIKESDNVIFFPAFSCAPQEPEFICCEDHVLREEFEKWMYQQSVILKVKEHVISDHLQTKSFRKVIQDEQFLLVQNVFEKRYRLFFHEYTFMIEIESDIWPTFRKRLISEYGDIMPVSWTKFTWASEGERVILWKEDYHLLNRIVRDRIELAKDEWDYFREALSKLKE